MIFLDASAVIAILNREPDSERLITAIEEARGQLNISPISTFESVLGLARARIGAPARRSTAENLRLATASVREFIRANDIREISSLPKSARARSSQPRHMERLSAILRTSISAIVSRILALRRWGRPSCTKGTTSPRPIWAADRSALKTPKEQRSCPPTRPASSATSPAITTAASAP
ncbi:type II toxin-antitoxin system VapC family toxin [Methylocystis sp. JR02]|uniref:type II toxin-antitoxin system VapC family toxin n=1 Tax=Methylocystis sp. JR02 TaxID=3046284 RepID=UPI0024B8B67E|nr:type II toxin-antitoxin system VapC family toxin [Methylocystis sp. JR02]MDJ0447957.1 type II toxin-antitoxin system VapC family toxin [Methylocystis sp. JR02]